MKPDRKAKTDSGFSRRRCAGKPTVANRHDSGLLHAHYQDHLRMSVRIDDQLPGLTYEDKVTSCALPTENFERGRISLIVAREGRR
jgi:hypothetical protein